MSHQSLHTPGGSRWAGFTQSHPWLKKHQASVGIGGSGWADGFTGDRSKKKKSKGTKKKKKALLEGEQGEEEEEEEG